MGSHGLQSNDDEGLRRFFYTKVKPFTIIYSCNFTKLHEECVITRLQSYTLCSFTITVRNILSVYRLRRCVNLQIVYYGIPNVKPVCGLFEYKESSRLNKTVKQSQFESPQRSRECDKRRRTILTEQFRARLRNLRQEGHLYSKHARVHKNGLAVRLQSLQVQIM